MQIAKLLVVAGLGGCVSTHSTAGTFVTDVRVRDGQLEVERCKLALDVVHRDGLRMLLFPLMVVGSDAGGVFTRRTPEVGKCTTTSTQMLAGAS